MRLPFRSLCCLSVGCLVVGSACQHAAVPTAAPVAAVKAASAVVAAGAPLQRVALGGTAETAREPASAPLTPPQLRRMVSQVAALLPTTLETKTKTAAQPSPVPRHDLSPGLVICEPQTDANAQDGQNNFGAGCRLYLALATAGRGEMGQTPLWTTVGRVRRENHWTSLRLAPDEATKLINQSGATHAAVGKLQEAKGRTTLTYQLYDRAGETLGNPVRLEGTRADIVRQLPQAAKTLAAALGVKLAAPALQTTPEILESVGDCSHAIGFTAEQVQTLQKLSSACGPAAFLLLFDRATIGDGPAYKRTVADALRAFPGNALVYGQTGANKIAGLLPYVKNLQAATTQYPQSYLLAYASTCAAHAAGDGEAELRAAHATVRNAPRNSDAFLTIAWSLSAAANRVREGKYYGMMDAEEEAFVQAVYPQWFRASQQAVELDPLSFAAQLDLSEAALFAGDSDTANAAWDKARTLAPNSSELYAWGLQMYQPKWGGEPAKLREVAQSAAQAKYSNPSEAMGIADGIREAGINDIADEMAGKLLTQADEAVAQNPNDAQAQYNRALALKAQRKTREAIEAFETVTHLCPNDAEAFYDLGTTLGEKGMHTRAVAALREAVRLSPHHDRAYCMLGWVYKHMNKMSEAEAALKQAIQLTPDYPQAYCVLGTVYVSQNKETEAIAAYNRALHLWPEFPEAYHNLTMLYLKRKNWPRALENASHLARMRPTDSQPWVMVAHCYGEQQKWPESEAASREAVSRDDANAYGHANLGVALLHQKQKAEGKQECERALSLNQDPGFTNELKGDMAKLL